MPWAVAIPAIIGAAGAAASSSQAAGAQKAGYAAAKQAYDDSVRDLEAIGIPTIEAQQLTMEEYKSQGKWTPELEQTVKLGDTAMGGITTDPTYKASQLKALGQLQDIGNNGGMTLADRANLEQVEGSIAAKQRGAREAILQDAQRRGGYGSGTALAAQLMSQQGGADEAHMAGINTAANAQARALQAIQAAGSMGTNLRNQDFSEQSEIAKARDAIAAWNAGNQQQVNNANAATQNAAQQWNLNNAQNISNANVDTRNKQQAYNKGLQQQQFQNQMQVASAKANARAGQATNAVNSGNAAANMWGNIGSSIAQAGTAGTQLLNENNEREKDRQVYGRPSAGLAKQGSYSL